MIGENLWERVLDLLLEPAGSVERVGFIDGVVTSGISVATTVVVPNASLHGGFYDVSADAMSQAGKHMRRHGLQRIAQVHTHERAWVGHSNRDDTLAYSREDGAISIVVPHHGRQRTPLVACGIHVCEARRWRQLDQPEIDEFFRIVPSELNFRRPAALPSTRRLRRLRLPRPGWMRR